MTQDRSPPGTRRSPGLLDSVTVKSACTVSWDTMTGDERTRFCGQCRLHVHDLTAMPREEAEDFIRSRLSEARTCIRLYRRPDGRVVVGNCRRAVRALRRRAFLLAASILGALGLGTGCWDEREPQTPDNPEKLEPVIMGVMCPPSADTPQPMAGDGEEPTVPTKDAPPSAETK